MCILNSFPCKKSWQTAVNRNLERGPLLPTPTQKQGSLLYRLKSLAVMLEWTPEKVCWHLGGRTVTTRSQRKYASTSKNTCLCLLDAEEASVILPPLQPMPAHSGYSANCFFIHQQYCQTREMPQILKSLLLPTGTCIWMPGSYGHHFSLIYQSSHLRWITRDISVLLSDKSPLCLRHSWSPVL